MKITSRFTIAVHILAAVRYFEEETDVTSAFLASSVGVNPVMIRMVMSDLKEAGLIRISRGKTGIHLAKPLEAITFYDVYKAVGCLEEEGLFHFHESPNPACPVGKNIHRAMSGRLHAVQTEMENRLKRETVGAVYEEILKKIKNKE